MGKFMNPTDQARKEARRKELKKNKKQRQQVRQAVIKREDPKNIIFEMENLDKVEYDTDNPPPYSVKVIQVIYDYLTFILVQFKLYFSSNQKEKRRKLREKLIKIIQYYQREDDKALGYQIKQMELDYERKRVQMAANYEAIMAAQRVKLDDIPLPDMDSIGN
jgi:WW domain-binding protein 11